MKFLIWGGSGWIGGMLVDIITAKGYDVVKAKSRLEDYPGILTELNEVNPDFVLNAAGIAGRPTVDWCEDNKQDTFLCNVVGVINLADACYRKGINLTNYSSGCIFKYDINHPMGYKIKETETPNFWESTYSVSKITAELALSAYNNVLTLRIRLPATDDNHPKNIITKLSKYTKVVNIANSITVLPELLPLSIDLTVKGVTGTINFVNPGAITHNQILELYKKHVNTNFTWQNFTEEEQNKILKSKRSNCELDTSLLESFVKVTPIKEAIENLMIKIAKINS